MEEERLLTKGEVCHKLGISKWTAVNLAKKGILRTVSISDRGDRRYYLNSVLKFMYGGDDKGEEVNSKVSIKTIEDGIVYVIQTHRFRSNPQGLMDAINIVEKEYGFNRDDIITKAYDMLENKVISFITYGKNAGLVIKIGGKNE